MFKLSLYALVALTLVARLSADVVEMNDGSRLVGKITQIYAGEITLETQFAGTLVLDQAQVRSFSTDTPLTVRLDDGATATGVVVAPGGEQVQVNLPAGSLTTATTEVAAAWPQGQRDPEAAARETELVSLQRKWRFEAAANVEGRDGNSEEFDTSMNFKATLDGPRDRLDMYASYAYSASKDETTGDTTSTTDEIIGGIRYTSFFAGPLGWYVRQELERDKFEDIDLRSTTASGLSYKFVDQDTMRLEGRAGLSFRYEAYEEDASTGTTPDNQDFFGLDFGLTYYWKFAEWGELNSELTYLPSVEDFGDFRLTHTSTVDIPLAFSDFWKLRVGLSNDYNSEPSGERERMDTTYFLSLLLTWQ